MATIILLDREEFSFRNIEEKPLAGAQSAFIELVKAFASLGHQVFVRNNCIEEHIDTNIDWRSISSSQIPQGDLYIINRSTSLLSLVPKGQRIFMWLHNEGKYLLRPSNLRVLFRFYPVLIFSGKYHRSTFPLSFLFRNLIIPYGVSLNFQHDKKGLDVPGPKVIFTSNPLRSLDWLVDRWKEIQKKVPKAELHVYSGPATYGAWGKSVSARMEEVLRLVKANENFNIILHEPVPKHELIEEIKTCRAMLYRGDKAETFCLAIAEMQVMGVPCVVQDLGSMNERIINGVTGFVTRTDKEFVDKSISILTDDELWISVNQSLTKGTFHKTWKESAEMFIHNI